MTGRTVPSVHKREREEKCLFTRVNKKKGKKLCVVAHTYNPSKQEAEAGGPEAQGQLSYLMCLK